MSLAASDSDSQSNIYRFVIQSRQKPDPRSRGLLHDAAALGISGLERLECQDIYFLRGALGPSDLQRIADQLLSDPITQQATWGRLLPAQSAAQPPAVESAAAVIEVTLRPGVTDPVADQLVRAAHEIGLSGVQQAASGQRYQLGWDAPPAAETVERLARRLLANEVIQRYTLGQIEPLFPDRLGTVAQNALVESVPLAGLDAAGLLALSQERRAALDLPEMQAIQDYYRSQPGGREPTDIEFEMIAQTWSEHCVHKTFKAWIEITPPAGQPAPAPINGLLKTYIRAATDQIAAPWVRSAFVDNAGILDFGEGYEISFKVETHNHPSAIEPFGGANTGVGGVIRDVLGVSARPIAATDVLCFGPQDQPPSSLPAGVLHPRRIQSGVVAGVQDYGNKIGIPTVNGAVLYDPGYTANPLVFCGCVGIAPKDSHPRQPNPGDRIVVLGGRTGRDGLRGATFSSMTMDAQTGEVAGASVQIGDPITEKGLIEVITMARDQRLYTAITDCGAGGLSSAVGEMTSESGGQVELGSVPLKYPGLAPWEIWLSEAQERMVLAVPPANLPALRSLCELYEVELTDIGAFNTSGRLTVAYAGQVVLDLDNHFLHHGIPQRRLQATYPQPLPKGRGEVGDSAARLLALLSQPNIASKEHIIRLYDHEVQGGTVVKPLAGPQRDGPSDACVLKPRQTGDSRRGIVLSNGINPAYGLLDAYGMAVSVVDEAVRNAVAVGADPDRLAILDNFCWGDPRRPETLGSLIQAAQGCHDAALHYQTPFISGKDSLNNEYLGADGQRHAIPPTLLISAIGQMDDIGCAVTLDLKQPGNSLYLLGRIDPGPHGVPGLPDYAPALYRALHRAICAGLVQACHDLSEGGLAVAAAEMCIAGRLGLDLNLGAKFGSPLMLFAETNGCLLVEVRPADQPALHELLAGLPYRALGTVTAEPTLAIQPARLRLPVETLLQAWQRIP